MNLKKMILEILEENHLHIPREVYQDMLDYYIEMYKKFKISGSKRVTDQKYPPNYFYPDFSKIGPTFDFIKNLPETPWVRLRFTSDNYQQFCRFQKGYNSEIQVSLNDPERVYTEVLEHELLHSLQHILKQHEQNRRLQVHPKDVRIKKGEKTFVSRDPLSVTRATLPDVKYAGVPKKKFINHYYDWHGYPIDSTARRRTTHQNRPIEYYPDLMSSLRDIQRSWFKFAASHAMDEKAINSEDKKKNFYMLFFNSIKNDQPYPEYAKNFVPSLAVKIFRTFKTSGKDFINMMLNKLYDGFVNKNVPFDYKKFKEIQNQTEEEATSNRNEKLLKQGIKENNFSFNKRELKFDYYDRSNIFRYLNDEKAEDYIEGNTSEYADNVFSEIGLRPKEDKNYNEYILFPSKIENIVKIFKKLFYLKKNSSLFKKTEDQVSDILWDSVKKFIFEFFF